MKRWILLASLAPALLAACSAFGPRESDAQVLSRYVEHAGPPIEKFTYLGRIDGWQSLSRTQLLLHTGVNSAYLLTAAQPCSNLRFANAIGITRTGQTVSRRFDSVLVGKERCMITQIRPVDYRAVKQQRRAS